MRGRGYWKYILFVVVIAVCGSYFAVVWRQERNAPPVLTIPAGVLSVSVKATPAELLAGITATDPEDGDVTDMVEVEGLSVFTEGIRRTVTYAAFDNNRHVVKGTRVIEYTDYKSPQFEIKEPIVITRNTRFSLKEFVTVTDQIDGDLSPFIKIVGGTLDSATEGMYPVTVSVINSCGDAQTAKLPIVVSNYAEEPPVSFTQPLIYLRQGDKHPFDWQEYLQAVPEGVTVEVTDNPVDIAVQEDYIVTCRWTDANGKSGYIYLSVVVR